MPIWRVLSPFNAPIKRVSLSFRLALTPSLITSGQAGLSNQKLADWSEIRKRECLTESVIDLDTNRITVELRERPQRFLRYEVISCRQLV